jgi:cytochrome c-type biogenesis protein
MEILFGYLAGLLTLINPCVLPVLPIVLATALQVNRFGPIALAAGMSLAFVSLGVIVSAFGPALGIHPETISRTAASLMIGFGVVLLVPRAIVLFSWLTDGVSSQADSQLNSMDQSGLIDQFFAGVLLGALWSPCIGPTLGGAIALASGGGSLLWSTSIMISFAAGVSNVIFLLAYGTRSILKRRKRLIRKLSVSAQNILGWILILVGMMILFKVHHMFEIWAVQNLPLWLQDLSVRY